MLSLHPPATGCAGDLNRSHRRATSAERVSRETGITEVGDANDGRWWPCPYSRRRSHAWACPSVQLSRKRLDAPGACSPPPPESRGSRQPLAPGCGLASRASPGRWHSIAGRRHEPSGSGVTRQVALDRCAKGPGGAPAHRWGMVGTHMTTGLADAAIERC